MISTTKRTVELARIMNRLGRILVRQIVVLLCFGGATAASAAERIIVYTVIPEQEINRGISQEFTRRTGIEVEMLNVPAAGTLAARIRSEKDHPRADIFADAPIDFHQALAKEGLLLPYKSPLETPDVVAKGYSDRDGYWHGWYALTTCIFWNREGLAKLIREKGVTAPKSWDDLLNPAFANQLVLSNPQTSAIGYVLLTDQMFRLGEDKGWAYTRALDKNVQQYTPSAPLTVTLVE
ncbi:MAG: extracellular solute-binding protein, partial [Proteobacteria bacterium]|nr:extracellular solute-binding protein [Pseudomonadota bacterium]